MIEDKGIPKFNVGYRFQYEEAQQSYVLLYPEGMVTFNGPAAEILKRIDGTTNIAQIVSSIEEAFSGVEVRDDVMEFLQDAVVQSWIAIEEST